MSRQPTPAVAPTRRTESSSPSRPDVSVGVEAGADHPDASGPVLVVEDDDKFADLVLRAFGREGIAAVHRADGDAALRVLRSGTRFSAAVLDVMIPHPDGLEVCRHLRRSEPRVPVVAISARSGAEHRARAHAAGADAFLAKPFPLRDLVDLTRRLIAGGRPS